jgi:hypothetical protein
MPAEVSSRPCCVHSGGGTGWHQWAFLPSSSSLLRWELAFQLWAWTPSSQQTFPTLFPPLDVLLEVSDFLKCLEIRYLLQKCLIFKIVNTLQKYFHIKHSSYSHHLIREEKKNKCYLHFTDRQNWDSERLSNWDHKAIRWQWQDANWT